MAGGQARLRAEVRNQGDAQAGQCRVAQDFAVVGGKAAGHGNDDAHAVHAGVAGNEAPGRGTLGARIVQAVVRGQVLRRGRGAVRGQVVRAGHEQRARGRQRPGHMGFGRRRDVAYGQIKPFQRQRAYLVRQVQLQPDLRMGTQEGRQARHELLARKGQRRRHAQQAARCGSQVAHAGEAVGNVLEGAARVVHQALARFGQAHAARGAGDQGDAGCTLQFGHALAHGRLAHAQARGGRGEAALLLQHDQPVQVAPQGLGLGIGFFICHAWIVQQIEQSIQAQRLGRQKAHF